MSDAFRKDPTSFLLLGLVAAFVLVVGLAIWWYRRLGNRSLFEFESRPLVPWGGLSVLAVFALYLGLIAVGVRPPREKDAEIPLRESLIRAAAINLGFILLLPPLLRATSGAKPSELGLSTRDWQMNVFRGIAACALALPVVYSVQVMAVTVWKPQDHLVEKAFAADHSLSMALLSGLGAVILAPVAEELLFRGVLLGTLWKIGATKEASELELDRRLEPKSWDASIDLMGNAAVSLLFAFVHTDQWPAPIPLFILSMVLGEVYRRSGSLVTPIVLHACFNGLSMGALLIASSFGLLPAGK